MGVCHVVYYIQIVFYGTHFVFQLSISWLNFLVYVCTNVFVCSKKGRCFELLIRGFSMKKFGVLIVDCC